MSIIPSLGRRGTDPVNNACSPGREETIKKRWTFIAGLVTKTLKLFSGTAGFLLKSDADGNVSLTDTLPAYTSAGNDATANELGILVASASGTYLVTVYHECTTAGAAGTLSTTITYTDERGTQSLKPAADVDLASTSNEAQGVAVVRCTANDLEFAKEITGVSGSPHYRSHVSAVKISA